MCNRKWSVSVHNGSSRHPLFAVPTLHLLLTTITIHRRLFTHLARLKMLTPRSDTHYLPHFGQTLKEGRYTVLRKLGEGVTSSTWLVQDSTSRQGFLTRLFLSLNLTLA